MESRETKRRGKTQLMDSKKVSLRAVEEEINGTKMKYIKGYPIVFNSIGQPYKWSDWREIILPESVKDVDFNETRVIINHNEDKIIGKIGINGAYQVDEIGVFFTLEEINTQLFRDTWELVNLGILDGMSFAFRADIIESNYDLKIDYIKHFTEIEEFTIVDSKRAAYNAATVLATK